MNAHDAMLESVAVYALGSLSPEEAQAVRAHLEKCEECRAEYRDLAPAASALAYAVEASPGPLLKRRIMAQIRTDARSPRPIVWPAYAAAACFILALGSWINSFSLSRQVDSLRAQDAQMTSAIADILAPDSKRYRIARGEVVRRGERVYIVMDTLPEPPSGKVYQAWTLSSGETKMTPSITFLPNGAGIAIVSIPADASNLAALAVSVEPAGGSKQPTSKPVFVLKFS